MTVPGVEPASRSCTVGADESEDVARVLIGTLSPESPLRAAGQNAAHVRTLAATDPSAWPPILVHGRTMRVLDGMHRIRAAQLRGHTHIAARFHDGDEADAFVRAVADNTVDGLPLCLVDRVAAAERIVGTHPAWTDEQIAAVTGVPERAVGAVRSRSAAVLGRDGRKRPLSGARNRLLASELFRAHPDLSVRQIAAAAGISPSTALDVRDRMSRGLDPVPTKLRASSSTPAESDGAPSGLDWERKLRTLGADPALRYTESGRALLRMFDAELANSRRREQLISGVPSYWAGTIADLARFLAAEWQQTATRLEQEDSARLEFNQA